MHNCHPERSVRIRFSNPHAQSKDPYKFHSHERLGEFVRINVPHPCIFARVCPNFAEGGRAGPRLALTNARERV
jgi:hypothetical protein